MSTKENDEIKLVNAKEDLFIETVIDFEDMRFMKRSKELEYVKFNKDIWKKMGEGKI